MMQYLTIFMIKFLGNTYMHLLAHTRTVVYIFTVQVGLQVTKMDTQDGLGSHQLLGKRLAKAFGIYQSHMLHLDHTDHYNAWEVFNS